MEAANISLLKEDTKIIIEHLRLFPGYNLAQDIEKRMRALNLTQSELADRMGASRSTIGKYLNNQARPNSKEKFKELGLALAMDEAELNKFLLSNCYPPLYAKNPLDLACRFILSKKDAFKLEKIVEVYNQFLKAKDLNRFLLSDDTEDIPTVNLSQEFSVNINSETGFLAWLAEHDQDMRAKGKTYLPHSDLANFVNLYIGDPESGKRSLYDFYICGNISVAVKNLLYPILAKKEIAVRRLRPKLIVFGLYVNMTKEEMAIMLSIPKLKSFDDPVSRVDRAILLALQMAHKRYPYFELANAKKALWNMGQNNWPTLRNFFENKKKKAAEAIAYYINNRSQRDILFEQYYTDYAAKSIANYVNDILMFLVDVKSLTDIEVSEYVHLINDDSYDE
ncbi:MAG: helix-turn-helix domain-containing protein [Deltaproteobacteria bacterium]|jgi:transcriptional regulator with XRE-family HTH domain|nr:helix-turn-helix domain-containing protein [Deltaproteobacteria bacterium]